MGLLLHLAAWLILAWQLLRRIYCEPTFTARLLPGTIALMLLCIHLYGLGDYPDNLVQMVQIWLIPVALVIMPTRRRYHGRASPHGRGLANSTRTQ